LPELIEVQLGMLVEFTLTEKRQKRRRTRRGEMREANSSLAQRLLKR
jgi:hypothetical protein